MKRAKNSLFIFVFFLSTSALACRLFSRPDPEPAPDPFFQTLRSDLVFTPDALPEAEAGVPYEVTIQISENETPVGDFQIIEGGLPNGLSYEFTEGEDRARIFGVPEEPGTYKFMVSVWCYGTNVSGQEGKKEYTLVVK